MANALYPTYKQLILGAGLNLTTLNLKVVLVDTGAYTYSAAHDFLDDIAVGARIATSGNLASKTVTNGVFDAADITITAVTGTTVEALVIYNDTGTAATSNLIAYMDTGVTGLPLTPNGGDVTIQWSGSGIFSL
jgi:hypothetical protein